MEQQDDLFETYETYIKEHQAEVEVLMNLEHVPRYIRMMEMKDVIRKLQQSIVELHQNSKFLDSAHTQGLGKSY